jgi:hypothetical protein
MTDQRVKGPRRLWKKALFSKNCPGWKTCPGLLFVFPFFEKSRIFGIPTIAVTVTEMVKDSGHWGDG